MNHRFFGALHFTFWITSLNRERSFVKLHEAKDLSMDPLGRILKFVHRDFDRRPSAVIGFINLVPSCRSPGLRGPKYPARVHVGDSAGFHTRRIWFALFHSFSFLSFISRWLVRCVRLLNSLPIRGEISVALRNGEANAEPGMPSREVANKWHAKFCQLLPR